eukprot:scaffold73484_cov30-Cyclotella_meneghiniana.AAC.1
MSKATNLSPASASTSVSPTITASTVGTNAVQHVQELHKASYRLRDAINELNSFIYNVTDESSSKASIKRNVCDFKRCIIPAMDKIADTIACCATHLTPYAGFGTKRACDRMEREDKKKIVDASNKRKSPDIQMLTHYVTPAKPTSSSQPHKRHCPPRQIAQANSAQDKTSESIVLPSAANGTMYRKLEVCKLLEKIDKSKRGKAMNEIIAQKLVGCGRSSLYSLFKKYCDGELVLDTDWHGMGRAPTIDTSGIKSISAKMQADDGRAFGSQDVNSLIVEHLKEKRIEAGFKPIDVPDKLPNSTLKIYEAQFALQPELAIVDKTNRKTNTRYTAENSIIASFNLLLVITATHFVEVPKLDSKVERDMRSLPDSTRQLLDLVTEAAGVPMAPVSPSLISSTDESTEYIFSGSTSNKRQATFRLASKSSLNSKNTSSIYSINEGMDMSGFRVKLTHTFNGTGGYAPVFVTVSGFSDYDLPFDGNMLVVKIPGLCVGGGIGSNDDIGYVCFTKKKKGVEKERFEYYHKHVLVPFIESNRRRYHGYDSNDGAEVPDDLTA